MSGLLNPATFDDEREPKDTIIVRPDGNGLSLGLADTGIVREAQAAGMLPDLIQHLKRNAPALWDRLRSSMNESEITMEEDAQKVVQEAVRQVMCKAMDDFALDRLVFNLPGAPVLRGLNQILNLGEGWMDNASGLIAPPYYKTHITGEAHITFQFDGPPNGYLTIAAIQKELGKRSAETVDVLEILLAHYGHSTRFFSEVTGEWIVKITPEEIADYRGRRSRGGSKAGLHDDLMQQVMMLADLKLTMRWEDKRTGESITFGDPIPAHLLNVEGWTFGKRGKTWTAFTYSPGHAISYFHNCTVRGHRALLRLDPRYGLAKRIGRYLALIGKGAARNGAPARAKIGTILQFAGEELYSKKPIRMVEQMAKAFNKLLEIGYLWKAPDLQALYERYYGRNYEAWLEHMVWAVLSSNIAQIKQPRLKAKVDG